MFGGHDNTQPQAAAAAAVTPDAAAEAPVDAGATLPAPAAAGYDTTNYGADDTAAVAAAPAEPVDEAVMPAAAPMAAGADDDELLDIKQQALQQLSPLVGHLDQTPEEKFRTTMMMIQASDNQALIKDAYAAAQQISDEKTRAQALLDIVNEINYFTQHQAQ
jgi:hypothetical protein